MSIASPDMCLDDLAMRVAQSGMRGGEGGDHVVNPELEGHIRRVATKEAAVLIGLHDGAGDGGARVLMTVRNASMRAHPGQIAFPGGRLEEADGGAVEAALREAREEVSLDPEQVTILGRLPPYLSASGYRIHPVIARLDAGVRLKADPDEVADIFHVPFGFIMDRTNLQRLSRVWNGVERHFYAIDWRDRHIWGVTAGIIAMMQERLYP